MDKSDITAFASIVIGAGLAAVTFAAPWEMSITLKHQLFWGGVLLVVCGGLLLADLHFLALKSVGSRILVPCGIFVCLMVAVIIVETSGRVSTRPIAEVTLPTQIPPHTSWVSDVISVHGNYRLALGFTSSQPLSISGQRYIDASGKVIFGPPVTQNVAPNSPTSYVINDGITYGSIVFTLTNETAGIALITASGLSMVP